MEEEIFSSHKKELNEIGRLCLICYGLDLTSDKLFTNSTYSNESPNTWVVFHNLFSQAVCQVLQFQLEKKTNAV